MSWRWQMSVTTCQYSSLAVRHAPAAPVIGSAMKPAMVSGPSRSMTSTTASASSHGTCGKSRNSGSKPALRVLWLPTARVAERQPVIAGMAADDLPPIRAALAELIAASQAQRGVGALAAAAGEEDLRESLRQPALDEPVAQRQALLARPDRHGVRAVHHRRVRGICDLGSTPADVADDGSGRAIEDAPAVGADQPAALAADDRRLLGGIGHELISGVVHPLSLSPRLRPGCGGT